MMSRNRRIFAVTAVLSFTSIFAFAHAVPKVMLPAADSTVSAPTQLSVVFSETLEPKFSSLELKNEKGDVVSKQPSVADSSNAKHLTLALPSLPAGVYTVHWVSMADDGHKASGDYKFTVK